MHRQSRLRIVCAYTYSNVTIRGWTASLLLLSTMLRILDDGISDLVAKGAHIAALLETFALCSLPLLRHRSSPSTPSIRICLQPVSTPRNGRQLRQDHFPFHLTLFCHTLHLLPFFSPLLPDRRARLSTCNSLSTKPPFHRQSRP